MSQEDCLLASQPSELERLQLQSQVWEPTGRQLLSKIGSGSGGRALDVGCGAMGWLRILAEWVGPSGQVVGTDVDESLLDAARSFLEEWDLGSWHFNPPAPAAERLIRSVSEIFAGMGGEAGRGLPEMLREIGDRAGRAGQMGHDLHPYPVLGDA